MGGVFGKSKADWSLEVYSPQGNPGDYYPPLMAWVLKDKKTDEILSVLSGPSNYDRKVERDKIKYSFRDLTDEEWKMLESKQKEFSAEYGKKIKDEEDADRKMADFRNIKQEQEAARQLENRKKECRELLGVGGRRRTKKSYRKKNSKKKSRSHR